MPRVERFKTRYPGVTYIEVRSSATGAAERVFYIRYRRAGKLVEEKAGRQFQDDMTPAKANLLRAAKIEGREESNQGQRDSQVAAKVAEESRWTLSRLWNEYKDHKTPGHALDTDNGRFTKYLAPAFGKRIPCEILTLDVDRLRVKLLKTRAPQTVKHVLALLKRVIRFGVRKGLCDSPNPRKLTVSLPRVDNETSEDLNPAELVRLLKAIEDESNTQAANFMRMALYTGMRRGELFKLEWRDVDFDRNFIHIREPKGGKSQKIPMNGMARQVLEGHPHVEGTPYVFPGQGGAQRQTIQIASNRIKTRAGLPPDFRPLHGLRHVFASTLASSGAVDMLTLQKLLTHKSATMTKRYSHLRDDALRSASDLAGDIFGKIGKAPDAGRKGKVVNMDSRNRNGYSD